jgi:hypothetical protein
LRRAVVEQCKATPHPPAPSPEIKKTISGEGERRGDEAGQGVTRARGDGCPSHDTRNSDMDNVVKHFRDLLQELLDSPTLTFNESNKIPLKGGVYRILENDNNWSSSVYVGKTGGLKNRLYSDLLMGNQSRHTLKAKLRATEFDSNAEAKKYLKEKCSIQVLVVEDEYERTRLEHFAIAILNPLYND